MKLKFKNNDYLLAWYLLFTPSINEDIKKLKYRLYNNYQDDYLKIQNDKIKIMSDPDNFIPDNDLIYDAIINSDVFIIFRKNSEKLMYNLKILWEKYENFIPDNLKLLLKEKFKEEFNVIVLDPQILKAEFLLGNKNNILWAYPIDDDNVHTLCSIIYLVISNYYSGEKLDTSIFSAILDLLIYNELATRFTGVNRYDDGNSEYLELKNKIYPYFLMYLGIFDNDELNRRAKRDGKIIDVNKLFIEYQFNKISLIEFTNFITENQKILFAGRN